MMRYQSIIIIIKIINRSENSIIMKQYSGILRVKRIIESRPGRPIKARRPDLQFMVRRPDFPIKIRRQSMPEG